MSVRRIVTVPEPILRDKARAIRQVTPEISTLIDDMIEAEDALSWALETARSLETETSP